MSEEKTAPSRRDFLKFAATSAPAAAVAVSVGAAPQKAEAAEAETGTGLRKTAHVSKYLETAKF